MQRGVTEEHALNVGLPQPSGASSVSEQTVDKNSCRLVSASTVLRTLSVFTH